MINYIYVQVLINMISGYDISLDQLKRLRKNYSGMIYFDVHTFSRGLDENGHRIFRRIADFNEWAQCIDILQTNESELLTLSDKKEEAEIVDELFSYGINQIIITKAERGATVFFREHKLVKNRILITGSNGMLGQRAVQFYSSKENIELLATSVEEKSVVDFVEYISSDIKDRDSIKKVIHNYCPDFIVHTAAFTNVDLSEKLREDAWKINVKGVEYIAEAARAIDAHIIHISTDYIFDGKNGPYDENAIPDPVGYYGRTELASENTLKISGTFFTI